MNDGSYREAKLGEDHRPGRGAWAPGSYFCKCVGCGNTFLGDKRARSCAPCAYSKDEAPPPMSEPRKSVSEELTMERLGVLEARGFCKACGTPNIDEAEFEALIRLARAGIDRLTTAKSGVGITDEMVEAGAIALYELERLGGPWKREMPPEVADARRRMWNELCDEDHRCYTEAEITVSGKNGYRQFARSALTAAIGKMGQ